MTTEREKIIQLANEHWHRHSFNNEYFDAVSFYHAAQAEAFETAAKLCDTDWNGDADTYASADAYNECAAAIREMAKEMK